MTDPHHPHLQSLAAYAARQGVAPADPLRQPLLEARAKAIAYQSIWNEPLPEGGRHTRHTSPAGTGIDLYIPDEARGPAPVLFYFHGGGFALNSVETHRRLTRLLAQRSGWAVAAVSYDLAPEARFPRQLIQAQDAIDWLRERAALLGLDGGRWAVGGDSAGANLALAATIARRDKGRSMPALGLLFYGMFSADLDTPSHRAFGGGAFGLTTERVDWFWSQYVAQLAERTNPLAAPLYADLRGLPPQMLIAAGLDCLKDDSVRLADRLTAAGVESRLQVVEGVPHSFMQMSAVLEPADRAIDDAVAALRAVRSRPIAVAAE
ncbi:Esterase/lipase [Magnetospirillum sp. LM-5]|uniref:alpha/beta hydrolase n=1 Tax=Magnetospirillum sp. LM-5 TaxID=2681466 RepID=UPI0013825B69|nr:alpha/beta hydrolase [Magnetospirillum sp. LM-5]CAA7622478.1 Esterase/lipase [Magnetospirillum sp. LM-5]